MIEDDHDEGNHTKGIELMLHHALSINFSQLDHVEAGESLFCASVTQLVERVILRLNLTTEECLGHDHNETNTRPTSAQGEGKFWPHFTTYIVALAKC